MSDSPPTTQPDKDQPKHPETARSGEHPGGALAHESLEEMSRRLMPRQAGDQLSGKLPDLKVTNGVMELSYNDSDFDRKVNSPIAFNTLKITGKPPEVKLCHWIDDQGYFFWYQNGTDNASHHHFPVGLKRIELENTNIDMDLERIKVSQSYLAQNTKTEQAFTSLDKQTNVLHYFYRMSQASEKVLALEESVLRQSTEHSNNPYFHIYLSDILTTQAMQPIIQGLLSGQPVKFDSPDTVKKLNEALAQLQTAQVLSKVELSNQRINQPPGNVTIPLAPLDIDNPYACWGGSLDQAQRREVALRFIMVMINSEALKKKDLLPPLELP